VTHVAVKELIAKGGHATIVLAHLGRGQDNRDILMLVGNRSESVVERPLCLGKIFDRTDAAVPPTGKGPPRLF
jgi:hypothetical protein